MPHRPDVAARGPAEPEIAAAGLTGTRAMAWAAFVLYVGISLTVVEAFPFFRFHMFAGTEDMVGELVFEDGAGQRLSHAALEAFRCESLDGLLPGPGPWERAYTPYRVDELRESVLGRARAAGDEGPAEPFELVRLVWRYDHDAEAIEGARVPVTRCTARRRAGP